MLAIARTLSSSSKKLKHPLFLSLSVLAQSLTNPSSSSSSSLSQTLNPQPQSPIKPLPLNSFCYFSSIPSLPLTRDGNYDETTSHVACPGCGVHWKHVTAAKTENETETLSFEKPVVCTRCHSLRHYGKVKDPNQIMTRMSREEQRVLQLHIGKELKPRTYRIEADHTIHIGGLMRLYIKRSFEDSIYITVWASPSLPLHVGKTEELLTMLEKHFGRQLQPPIGENRVEELGKWVNREFRVRGYCWKSCPMDIAASGLDWFAVEIKGKALLGVWTYEGVDVATRRPTPLKLLVSKIVSKADQASNKQRQDAKRKRSNPKASVLAESPLLTVDADSNSC